MPFDPEPRNDETAVSVALPEEPTDMSCEGGQGWITEEAFFKHVEETVQARARWLNRAMDTRWVRTWKPDESRILERRAKARLIIEGFTDPDVP